MIIADTTVLPNIEPTAQ